MRNLIAELAHTVAGTSKPVEIVDTTKPVAAPVVKPLNAKQRKAAAKLAAAANTVVPPVVTVHDETPTLNLGTPGTALAVIPAAPARVVLVQSSKAAAKQAATDKRNTEKAASAAVAAERNAKLDSLRAFVTALYAGPSPVFHSNNSTKPADIVARISVPVQRIGTAPTERDASFAHAIGTLSDTFANLSDAFAVGADLGAISRLASVGALSTHDGAIYAMPRAIKAVSKRALPSQYSLDLDYRALCGKLNIAVPAAVAASIAAFEALAQRRA